MHGRFHVLLQSISSGLSETIDLDAGSDQFIGLHIRSRIAHRIEAAVSGSILLVEATSANTRADEIEFALDMQDNVGWH